MADTPQRQLHVPGALNVRDLGGYSTCSGGITRFGVFFRADSLHQVTLDGQQTLFKAGVRTIIDLRSDQEVDAAPPQAFAPDHYHIPIIPPQTSPQAAMNAIPENLEMLYQVLLQSCQPAFLRVFEQIAAAETGAVLFHCTAGKDRTGMVAALLLGLAGVDDTTIADDYSLSAANIEPMITAMREQMRKAGMEIATFDRLMGSNRETMLATLDYLKRAFGGAESYLLHVGLTVDQLETIKARLVE